MTTFEEQIVREGRDFFRKVLCLAGDLAHQGHAGPEDLLRLHDYRCKWGDVQATMHEVLHLIPHMGTTCAAAIHAVTTGTGRTDASLTLRSPDSLQEIMSAYPEASSALAGLDSRDLAVDVFSSGDVAALTLRPGSIPDVVIVAALTVAAELGACWTTAGISRPPGGQLEAIITHEGETE